jgi:hypothetical protein
MFGNVKTLLLLVCVLAAEYWQESSFIAHHCLAMDDIIEVPSLILSVRLSLSPPKVLPSF